MSIAYDSSRTPTENGAPKPPTPPAWTVNRTNPVMYIGADKSPRRHASCNVAAARIDETGIDQAKLTVFGYVVDYLDKFPAAPVPFHDLEPERAAQAAAQRLLDNTPLAGPIETADEFRGRLRELAAMRERKVSAHGRDLSSAADDAVTSAVELIESSLAALAAENPLALAAVCEAGAKHIAEMEYKERSRETVSPLVRIRDALTMIDSPTSPVPAHKREVLRQLLLAAGQEKIRDELTALASDTTQVRFRKRMAKLAEQLRAWVQFSRSCRDHLDTTLQLLRDRREVNDEAMAGGDASGDILLPGPTSDAVLNAIARQLQSSRAESMDQMREEYLRRIASEGRDFVEEGQGPLPALAALDPQTSVAAIDDIVEPYLGEFSLYQAVKQYGPARLADELYAGAEPLLHLSRESGRLNVELTPVTIIDLPKPGTNDDAAVYDKLQRAFERHPPIFVRQTIAATKSVVVVRSLAGYSAALLADNDSLAVAYAESRRLEHRPHLFGFLADTPHGFASEIITETVRELERLESADDHSPTYDSDSNGD